MSEVSLYRKFRPQTFGHLVGQDHVRVTLLNAIKSGRLSHAYLFTGPRGTGKTSTARLFAKAINCVNPSAEGEPCEACDICRDITIGRLIDVVEIDAASHTGVDDVRELIDKLHFAPTRAKNKVYIVDEVHMLSKGAFNAFLKTLEEPPENVYFILATTEAHKVPETIISRCHRFDFKRIDEKTVMARLAYIAQMEGVVADDEAMELIARHVDGGLRDAIGLFEQLVVEGVLSASHVKRILGVAGGSAIEKFYGLLVGAGGGGVPGGASSGGHGDAMGALGFLQELYREGTDFVQFTKDVLEKMRNEMLKAVESRDVRAIGDRVRMIEIFQKAFDQLRGSVIVQLPLELAVVKFLNPEVVVSVAAVSAAVPPKVVTASAPVAAKPATAPVAVAPMASAPVAPVVRVAAKPAEEVASEVSSAMSSSNAPAVGLTVEALKKQWPRVIEHIKTPKLRISLKDVRTYEIAGHVITLGFSAKFHLDTVMDGALRSELEGAIESAIGGAVKVEARLERVELHASIDKVARREDAEVAFSDRVQAAAVAEDDAATDDIAAMFGGEVVD